MHLRLIVLSCLIMFGQVPVLAATPLAADLNGDGSVDYADLAVLKAHIYGPGPQGDIDGNGVVDIRDASLLKAAMVGGARSVLPKGLSRGQELRVYFQPNALDFGYDEIAQFELWVDFSADPTIGGGLDVQFDASLLSFESFEFDENIPDDPDFRRQPDLIGGNLLSGFAFGNFDVGISGPVRVGFLRFRTVAGGVSGTIFTGPNDSPVGPFVSFTTFVGQSPMFESATFTVPTAVLSLAISKSRVGASTVPGTPIVYEIFIQNDGPDSLIGAQVSDIIPSQLQILGWTCEATPGSECGGTGPVIDDVFDVPYLVANGAVTYTIITQALSSATGTVSNSVSVTVAPGVTNTGDASATDEFTLTPEVSLSISKTDGLAEVDAGIPLRYFIAVENAGPSDLVGAIVNDVMPSLLLGAEWTCVSVPLGSCAAGPVAGDIADTLSIRSGFAALYIINAFTDLSVPGIVENIVTVDMPAGTINNGDTSASDLTTLLPPSPDISLDLAKLKFGVTIIGTIANRAVTISNSGGPLLLGQVSDAALPFSKAADSCSNQTLNPGESCEIEVEFLPQVQGAATAIITVPSNDPETPIVDILMGGVGLNEPIEVAIDIIPQVCPNPLLLDATQEQVVEVTILGSDVFDVNTIDVASVHFVSLCPLRSRIADVATPYFPLLGKELPTDCNALGADGFDDLVIQYDARRLARWLLDNGATDTVVLRVRAVLLEEFGEAPLFGEDVMLLINPVSENGTEDTP